MSNSDCTPNSFIHDSLPRTTISNVSDVLELLCTLEMGGLSERAQFGLFLVMHQCSETLRYVEARLSKADTTD